MSFGREKRRLVGLAALLAPLPLPFNDALSWPVFAAYLVAVALFLARARREPRRWLPVWGMNVLGVAYLPFFVLDATVFSGGRLVEPVIHLLLFAVVAKLFSLTRERDKWHAMLGVSFLFLASMATSVHPAVVLYLVGFLVLLLLLLARFAFLHVLAALGHRETVPAPLPLGRFLAYATVAVLLVAAPLFTGLPRMRAPYLVGSGGVALGYDEPQFPDELTLDSIGLARGSPEVVMRLRYPARPFPAAPIRFKAGTHDQLRRGVWLRTSEGGETLTREPGKLGFQLARAPATGSVEVWLKPLLGPRLPLPVEAVALELDTYAVIQGRSGTVSLLQAPTGVVQYKVGLAPLPVDRAVPPGASGESPTLDRSAVTPEMAALAAQVAGGGSSRERAQALERHFHREYEYTLDFVGRGGDTPLEDFLFKFKSGHCEYFASAMVLLLRSQGIHARLATGFLGAEYNPLEGYYIVRQYNAHAWVEAYLPGEGWQIFDPTPPSGRPASGKSGLFALVGQAYDYLMFRWDRYVLTYGFYDQVQLFFRLRQAWERLWASFSRQQGKGVEEAPAAVEEGGEPAPGEAAGRRWVPLWLAALGLTLAVLGGLAWRRRRSAPAATGAYRWLRRRLARAGLPADEALAPLALKAAAERRYPKAAEAAGRIVDFYLRESFGGAVLGEEERRAVEEARAAAGRALRRAS